MSSFRVKSCSSSARMMRTGIEVRKRGKDEDAKRENEDEQNFPDDADVEMRVPFALVITSHQF